MSSPPHREAPRPVNETVPSRLLCVVHLANFWPRCKGKLPHTGLPPENMRRFREAYGTRLSVFPKFETQMPESGPRKELT